MDPERWEYGSDFHFSGESAVSGGGRGAWSDHPNSLWSSGRDALRALLAWARDQLKVRRVWWPTYLCQDIVSSAVDCGLAFSAYADAPDAQPPDLTSLAWEPGDLLFSIVYFGIREPARLGIPDHVVVVEDHTHD